MTVSPNTTEAPFRYTFTPDVPDLLESIGASLAVTTYQAGKLAVFRANGGRLSLLLRSFANVKGMAVEPRRTLPACDEPETRSDQGDTRQVENLPHGRMALATDYQIWHLQNWPGVAAKMDSNKGVDEASGLDACFLPRSSHITGNIDAHEIAYGSDRELWIANTMFSCLATLDDTYSFVPRWRPPFVTELAREDRCHLNGLAMLNGRPKYVTAFAETNTQEGWRDHKRDGGMVIDVEANQIVASGLCMPHSPRVHHGDVWVLNSGNGQVARVDLNHGSTEPITKLPGYTRGLDFHQQYAFVGLSKVRESNTFGGIPIADNATSRICGVAIVDITNGQQVGQIEFVGDVHEIFDVKLIHGIRNPAVVGFERSTIQVSCVAAPEREIGE